MLLSVLLPAGSARAGSGEKSSTTRRPASSGNALQQGLASWHEVSGPPSKCRTAGKRLWNNSELIAAHRTLPLGSKVRVTNLKNNQTVVVEIADRGPYANGRVIDLSVAAAIRIGMITSGVAKVRLELVPDEQTTASVPLVGAWIAMTMAPWQGWSLSLTAA